MAAKTDVTKGSRKRRRTQAQKMGRLKYIIKLLHRLERKVGEIDARTRTLMAGLKDLMTFRQDYLKGVVVGDELDEAIIQRLLEVPEELPSRIALQLKARGFRRLERWKVTRRIQGMNRRLKRELGQAAFEKRGHSWALTSFIRDAWGLPREEIPSGPFEMRLGSGPSEEEEPEMD